MEWLSNFLLQCLYQLNSPKPSSSIWARLLMVCHLACRLSAIVTDGTSVLESRPHVWESNAIIRNYFRELFSSCHALKQFTHLDPKWHWLILYSTCSKRLIHKFFYPCRKIIGQCYHWHKRNLGVVFSTTLLHKIVVSRKFRHPWTCQCSSNHEFIYSNNNNMSDCILCPARC